MTPGERTGFLAAGMREGHVDILARLLRDHAVWMTQDFKIRVRPLSECGDPQICHWDEAQRIAGLCVTVAPIPIGRAKPLRKPLAVKRA